MSMLGEQIKELREAAGRLEGYQCGEVSRMMREAADTIEGLRDRLHELQGVGGESNYARLFGTPERAARTISVTATCMEPTTVCPDCIYKDYCDTECSYDALLEWLRGDAE